MKGIFHCVFCHVILLLSSAFYFLAPEVVHTPSADFSPSKWIYGLCGAVLGLAGETHVCAKMRKNLGNIHPDTKWLSNEIFFMDCYPGTSAHLLSRTTKLDRQEANFFHCSSLPEHSFVFFYFSLSFTFHWARLMRHFLRRTLSWHEATKKWTYLF